MARHHGRIIIFVLAGACGLLLVHDRIASGAVLSSPLVKRDKDQSDESRKRWERLPKEKKQELLENYKKFKAMPDAEQRRLRERHKKLEMMRKSLRLSAENGQSAIREKNKTEINRRIKQLIQRREKELDTRFPVENPHKNRRDRIRQLRQNLENINASSFGVFLERLVKEGHLKENEARRIQSLPHNERKKTVFEIGKQRIMHEMEGLVPHDDLEDLRRLEPWTFHRWRRSEQERRGAIGPVGRLMALTPEQEASLNRIPRGEERERIRQALFQENLKRRLEPLGVDGPTIQKVLSMPPTQRQQRLMRMLKSLRQNQQQLSPEARAILDELLKERSPRRSQMRRNGSSRSPRRN